METANTDTHRTYLEAAETFSNWLGTASEKPGSEEWQRRYAELSQNVIRAYKSLCGAGSVRLRNERTIQVKVART